MYFKNINIDDHSFIIFLEKCKTVLLSHSHSVLVSLKKVTNIQVLIPWPNQNYKFVPCLLKGFLNQTRNRNVRRSK